MRTLNKNKQKMYYALQTGTEPEYKTDDDGNIEYDYYLDGDGNKIYYVDDEGNKTPLYTGHTRLVYSEPVEFQGNIALSGGESQAVEFGLNLGDYSAVLVCEKSEIPITETSRIWHTTEPKTYPDGTADENTADYTVVKVSPSINVDRYVLQKIVK